MQITDKGLIFLIYKELLETYQQKTNNSIAEKDKGELPWWSSGQHSALPAGGMYFLLLHEQHLLHAAAYSRSIKRNNTVHVRHYFCMQVGVQSLVRECNILPVVQHSQKGGKKERTWRDIFILMTLKQAKCFKQDPNT